MKRADPRFQMRIKKEKDFYTFSFFVPCWGLNLFPFYFATAGSTALKL
jgi:hypothetical protein